MHRIPVYLFTDSESTLGSIASSKQVSTKSLRNFIFDLKQRLVNDEIMSYAWLPTDSMWADILTKEKNVPQNFGKVITTITLALGDTTINEVKSFGQEVRMTNIRNSMKTPETEI